MKEKICQRAAELGFDACRFTAAAPPEHAAQLDAWLAEQRHGEMEYLRRNAHKRRDPQQVLPGAKTIIALAASYHLGELGGRGSTCASSAGKNWAGVEPGPPALHGSLTPSLSRSGGEGARRAGEGALRDSFNEPESEADSTFNLQPSTLGLVARYARFADYHDVLGERLKKLSAFVDGLGGTATRSLWYADTGPVLERDFAQRAGLGFTGKHTNLISRRLGNWIFLAEILTTLEVPPDAPEKNRCGSCARCLDACPTRAITAPFQLDARRCISYLTIELKGAIPVELRPAIGNRIYGCDDCLAACPWNRFAQAGRLMQPHARGDLDAPDLLELLALDEAGFRQKFAGTPLLRAKRRGLLRNVCVALGNTAGPEALPALQRAAEDSEPLIAEHARWAVGEIKRVAGAAPP